jgi:hypothetical protein
MTNLLETGDHTRTKKQFKTTKEIRKNPSNSGEQTYTATLLHLTGDGKFLPPLAISCRSHGLWRT